MNYIRHMNAFFTLVKQDERLTSSHLSLYMALFQYWNYNRFQNPFPVYRENIMNLSKIGSKNTYHKCIKELHEARYIYYHPSQSKFLPVKVSIGRLDIPEEPVSRFKQLDLFIVNESLSTKQTPSPFGGRLGWGPGGGLCPKFDTDSVPNLTATGTDFDTGTVPKMGHNIKHKHFKKTESKPPAQKIFDKNEKLSTAINSLGGVPIVGHNQLPSALAGGVEKINPSIVFVEEFFKQNNYPEIEAKKFFNHYTAIGWKIKGITPIEDWQAAAHKWMINAKKWEPADEAKSPSIGGGFRGRPDVETLYNQFLEGKKIFPLILPSHFDELKLELTDQIMQEALKERINQVSGTNNHSLNQLWQAYLAADPQNELLKKDTPNLINLARRMAVLQYFKNQKQISSHK